PRVQPDAPPIRAAEAGPDSPTESLQPVVQDKNDNDNGPDPRKRKIFKCKRNAEFPLPGKHGHLLIWDPDQGRWVSCGTLQTSGKRGNYEPPWEKPEDSRDPDDPKTDKGRK